MSNPRKVCCQIPSACSQLKRRRFSGTFKREGRRAVYAAFNFAYLGLSALPTTAAITCEDLRSRWPYRSEVVWMLSWPRWRWMTVSGTPAWISHDAFVCLRSCGLGRLVRPFTLALATAGTQAFVWKF